MPQEPIGFLVLRALADSDFFRAVVPELTGSADIKLNPRVSLRQFGPKGKAVGRSLPLDGFARLNPATFRRDTGLATIWRLALNSNRDQSPTPKHEIETSARKPLHVQYAELLRLRKAVQEAAAAQPAAKRRRASNTLS